MPTINIPVGTLLGKCCIVEVLGQGGMGIVYRGFHEGLKSQVAIKVLQKDSEEHLQNFFHEAQAIAKLSHPNIMKIYDIEYDPNTGVHYIVAQLIIGKTLDQLLKESGAFEPLKALNIILETAKGLAYAHKMGIIHRDIKPGNIMLDQQNHVKITDFGLAYTMDADHIENSKILGTPHYIAPEQCSGQKLDGRADIYALGGTFYHLLTGVPPFHGNYTPAQLIRLHLTESPQPLEQLAPKTPRSIIQCIRKMMARDINERFASCEFLCEHLEQLKPGLQKVKCPRCGIENSLEKVFDCPRCGSKNLCITHLVSAKHCCDYCDKMSRDVEEHKIVTDLPNWIEGLYFGSRQKVQGMLYIQTSELSINLTVTGDTLSSTKPQNATQSSKEPQSLLRTRDVNYEKLRQKYNLTANVPEDRANLFLMKQKILEVVIGTLHKIKFYSLHSSLPMLPPHPTPIPLPYDKQTMFHFLEMSARIYKSLWIPGGLTLQSHSRNVSLMFTDTGVAIAQITKNEEIFIQNPYEAVNILIELLRPDVFKIEYQDPIIFPPLPREFTHRLPESSEVLSFLRESSWENLLQFIPDLSDVLYPDLGHEINWNQNSWQQLLKKLATSLNLEKWLSLPGLSRFNALHAIIILVAMIKEILREITESLMSQARFLTAKENQAVSSITTRHTRRDESITPKSSPTGTGKDPKSDIRDEHPQLNIPSANSSTSGTRKISLDNSSTSGTRKILLETNPALLSPSVNTISTPTLSAAVNTSTSGTRKILLESNPALLSPSVNTISTPTLSAAVNTSTSGTRKILLETNPALLSPSVNTIGTRKITKEATTPPPSYTSQEKIGQFQSETTGTHKIPIKETTHRPQTPYIPSNESNVSPTTPSTSASESNTISPNRAMLDLLLQNLETLSPDHPELLKILTRHNLSPKNRDDSARYYARLGDIYYRRDNMVKAQHYYQSAIDTGANAEEAKLGLMEIYFKGGQREAASKLGLELMPLLQHKGHSELDNLHHVCRRLLEINSGLIECRRELIRIYNLQKNTSKAITEYEQLAEFYEQMGNREQLADSYRKILELDSRREDIQQKLQLLQDLNWVDNPSQAQQTTSYNIFDKVSPLCIALLVLLLGIQGWRDFGHYIMLQNISQQIKLEEWQQAQTNLAKLENRFFLFLPQARALMRTYSTQLEGIKESSQKRQASQILQQERQYNLQQAIMNLYQRENATTKYTTFCQEWWELTNDQIWKEELQKLEPKS